MSHRVRLLLPEIWVWPGGLALVLVWLLALLLGAMLALSSLPAMVALVAGTSLLLLIVIEPFAGLALALLLGPLGALESFLLGGSALDSGQIALFITFCSWFGYGARRRHLTLARTPLNLPWLLFLLFGAVTMLQAVSLEYGVRELVKWLEIGLIMLMVVDLSQRERVSGKVSMAGRAANGRRYAPWLVAMLLVPGVVQALIGIWQFAIVGSGPDHFAISGRFFRAFGTFQQPNPFGGFMNLTLLLALGALTGRLAVIWQRWRGAAAPVISARFLGWTAVTAVAAVIIALGLVASWSRGAWLAFAVGAAVMALFWPKKRWQGLLILAGSVLVLAAGARTGLLPQAVSGRITDFTADLSVGDVRGALINDENYAVVERLAHWQAAQAMARENLWLGVGLGNYEPAYADYALVNWPEALGHAHNYYLNLLAETGVVGLVIYLWFWAAVIWQSVRLLARCEWPNRGIVLGMLGCWAALSAHHLVDKLYVNNIYVYLGVLLGLLQVLASAQVAAPGRIETAADTGVGKPMPVRARS